MVPTLATLVGRAIIAFEIGADPRRIERTHGRGRAENRTTDRLTRKGGRLQAVEHEIVGRIVRRADLLDDHALLTCKLRRIERRVGENIGQNVERERHVGLEHARIERGGLHAGRRVEIAADRLDLLGDLLRAAPRRALERHVFEQMGNAVLVGQFVAAAGAHPHAERCGLQMRHVVGDDGQTGRQAGDVDAHAAAPSCAARLAARMKRSTAA